MHTFLNYQITESTKPSVIDHITHKCVLNTGRTYFMYFVQLMANAFKSDLFESA